jgi:hydrogenase maturation protein HypF
MNDAKPIQRMRLTIRGAVQGVGFRPFVYRLALELELVGWVKNSSQGLHVEVEGPSARLQEFLFRIEREKPSHSFIQSLESSFLDPIGYPSFVIEKSDDSGSKTALILPDIATCPECRAEIVDPTNRRFRYAFTNCTHCGPRFSIIQALPYDRPHTTMKKFTMCAKCQSEYDDPLNRRFHAQPNACSHCGPRLELWNTKGECISQCDAALVQAAAALREGAIVAVKSIGGFQLLADARNPTSIARLRQGKHREEKPFALMFPSLERVQDACHVSPLEARLLTSAEAPIVLLLRQAKRTDISEQVAPQNPYWGVMLPYTPLHHLLLADLQFPVVATSGNLSDEPICTDEHDALERLRDFTDLFLVHNRPIARHVDDSIVRLMAGRELLLRRARGYAPLPIRLKKPLPNTLAVGSHLKNTIALATGHSVFVSQHIGDLETMPAYQAFCQVINDFEKMYEIQPEHLVSDAHPDYLSTKYAKAQTVPVTSVQHHLAHILSCMAENEIEGSVLGVAWDGTGFGLDGTAWGGEFFLVNEASAERVAHLRQFWLPGGEKAIREPRRSALGLLYAFWGEALWEEKKLNIWQHFTQRELKILREMLKKQINTPRTSSIGRLFDAVASLIELRQIAKFEGQAAMELEFALHHAEITDDRYFFKLTQALPAVNPGLLVLDWEPMLLEILDEMRHPVAVGTMAAKFHHALVEMIVTVAKRMNQERVVLSGGCFQNKYLTERAVQRLHDEGFRTYWHQRVPPNDGGIALGQILATIKTKD